MEAKAHYVIWNHDPPKRGEVKRKVGIIRSLEKDGFKITCTTSYGDQISSILRPKMPYGAVGMTEIVGVRL